MNLRLTLVLLCTIATALAEGRLNTYGKIGDTRYTTSITYTALRSSSDWNPSKGAPPVDQLTALDKARTLLAAQFPDFGPHQVTGITLSESNSGAWLYKVSFLGKPADGSSKAAMLTYFILLNSTTVSPQPSTSH